MSSNRATLKSREKSGNCKAVSDPISSSKVNSYDKKLIQEFAKLSQLRDMFGDNDLPSHHDAESSKENIPKLPWDEKSRLQMEKQVHHLESIVLSLKCSPRTMKNKQNRVEQAFVWESESSFRRHADKLTLWKSVEYRAEKVSLEKKIAHFQTECEVQAKRFGTVVEHNLPKTIEDLVRTCESLSASINMQLDQYHSQHGGSQKHRTTISPQSKETIAVKTEFDTSFTDQKLSFSEKQSTYLCMQKTKLEEFFQYQQRVLRLLSKYCKMLLAQEKLGSMFAPEFHPDSNTTLNDSVVSESTSYSIFSSPDRPSSSNTQMVKTYDSKSAELRNVNKMFGHLLERKVKQHVATGGLRSALSQLKRDLRSHSFNIDHVHNDGDAIDGLSEASRVVDRPSSLQLRSQILHLRERQNSLKSEVEEKLSALNQLTSVISASCNSSHENMSAQLKKERLTSFIEQQNRILSYLQTVQQRSETAKNILDEEQTRLRKQTLHLETCASEVKDLEEFVLHLKEDLKRLALSGQKKQRLTISHNDDFAQKICSIVKEYEKTCASFPTDRLSGENYLNLKQIRDQSVFIKDEPYYESSASECHESLFGSVIDSLSDKSTLLSAKKFDPKTVLKQEFATSSKSFQMLTYSDLMNFVRHLQTDAEHCRSSVSEKLAQKRILVHSVEEEISKCEGSVSSLHQTRSNQSQSLLELTKQLNHVEMQLASHMGQWNNMQKHWSSNPAQKMERDAFVQFFLHPTQTSLNIARWKNGIPN